MYSPKVLLAVLAASVLMISCSEFSKTGSTLPPTNYDVVLLDTDEGWNLGKGVGESCTDTSECRLGLACNPTTATCELDGSIEEDSSCFLSGECGAGLVCSPNTENLALGKTCVPEGDGQQWDVCSTDGDCKKGFYCKPIGFTGTCQPEGDQDVGGDCETTDDCYAGLICGDDGTCGIFGMQVPRYTGASCAPSSQITGPPRVFFEVPRAGAALEEFYRLPFPNDVRLHDGHMDLSGHPTPGPGVVGMDVAKRVIEVMERDLTGWGTNPVVYFRFSTSPLNSSLSEEEDDRKLLLLDITDPADLDTYGKVRALNWNFDPGRKLYICYNSLAVYVPYSRPLAANRIYTVILTNGIKAKPEADGGIPRDYQKDDDFKAVLSSSTPSDGDLAEAWTRYQPLRDFLASSTAADLGLSNDSIIGATVFSTMDPREPVRGLAKAVMAKGEPAISDLVLCDEGVVSPCDDGLEGEAHVRGCFGASEDYYEFQGKVRLPKYQAGTLPYLDPTDGGRMEFNSAGEPVQKGVDEVCFSLTVPKCTDCVKPEAGWPVVLYAHGTGGTYRNHITTGVVDQLNNITLTGEAGDRQVSYAVIGFDQVMHGSRKGDTEVETDSLVFNFRNPQAALGNFLQSAADDFALVNLLKGQALGTQVEALAAGVGPLDSGKIVFVGHSQGGTSGPLSLPWESRVMAAVLSGSGGGLVDSLLRKFAPVDIKDGVIMALQDENVSRIHPVLALLQHYFEAVDPINFGEALFYRPEPDMQKMRTFHIFGLEDQHTPPATLRNLSAAMRADLAPSKGLGDDFDEFSGVSVVELPVTVSRGLTVEYKPDGDYEGHFVMFRHASCRKHLQSFIGTAALDTNPTISD